MSNQTWQHQIICQTTTSGQTTIYFWKGYSYESLIIIWWTDLWLDLTLQLKNYKFITDGTYSVFENFCELRRNISWQRCKKLNEKLLIHCRAFPSYQRNINSLAKIKYISFIEQNVLSSVSIALKLCLKTVQKESQEQRMQFRWKIKRVRW